MRLDEIERLALKLIKEGFTTYPQMEAEFRKRVGSCRNPVRERPVNQSKTWGTPLKRALSSLGHQRKIVFNAKTRKYSLIGRKSYHPPVSPEALLERYMKDVRDDIEPEVLLL